MRELYTEISFYLVLNLVDSQSTKHLKERSNDHTKEKNNTPKPRVKTQTSYRDSESSSEEEYAVWMPGHNQNTHLNLQAPVFKPTMKRLSRVGIQTERFIQDERSQPQDGGGTTPDRDQVEETTHQEQDMIQSQDSNPRKSQNQNTKCAKRMQCHQGMTTNLRELDVLQGHTKQDVSLHTMN